MDGHVEVHQVVVARPGSPYNSGGKLFDTSLMTIIIESYIHHQPASKLSPIFVYNTLLLAYSVYILAYLIS